MKTALCCIAKNEERYIHEWVDYHLKLGFDKIYIYCDDWQCPIDECENVTTIQFRGIPAPQMPSYNHFLATLAKPYDYVMFLDVDEFLVLKNRSSVQEFLNGKTESIGINWVLFGDNGLADDGSEGVLKRFTMRQAVPNRHVKTLVRVADGVKMQTPHNPYGEWLGSDGQMHTYAFCRNGNTQEAQVNHYFCKTYEEWKQKQARGCADSAEIRPDSDFQRHNFNEIEDFLARDFFNSK